MNDMMLTITFAVIGWLVFIFGFILGDTAVSSTGLGMVVVGAILAGYRFYIEKRWPILVPLVMQRGKALVYDLGERAALLGESKSGYRTVKLMKSKDSTPPFAYENLAITAKGKTVMPLFSPTKGQYFAVNLKSPQMEVVEDTAARNWNILEHRRSREMYKDSVNPFIKYAPYIMFGTIGALFIFTVIYTTERFGMMAGAVSGASQVLADAMKAIANMPQSAAPMP